MGSREKMAEYLDRRASLDTGPAGAGICRGRIRQLLDPDSFVELDSMVESRGLNFGFSRTPVAGDGVVTGYGTLDGRLVYLAAQDPAVFGGSIGQMHAAKICKAIELACAACVPFIGLYDTGGTRIDEGVVGLEGLGSLLSSLAAASGEIPLIAAVFGPCAGGAAFAAAASDFVLMSEKGSGIYMNGPMVVSGVENRSIDPADIGGAMIHAVETGLASLIAPDEAGLISQIHRLMAYLPDCSAGFWQTPVSDDDPNRASDRLDQLVSEMDSGYDMREIIREVFDEDSFLEIAERHASGLITGLARLNGKTVGILANSAPRLNMAMAAKGVRLADLCDRFGFPLITLADTEGYAIALAQEKGGLVQAGASLMQAMLRLGVPRVGVVIGKAIGTAYLCMCSKSCGTDLLYAWPTAEIAVVNPDTAAHIVYRRQIAASADPANARNDFVRRYADEVASPYVAASLGFIDEVIRPSATRPRLISALEMLTLAYQ